MQLTDIVELVAKRGMERHAEKRGGVMLPLAIGAMLPGIARHAIERMHSSEQELAKTAADWSGRPSGGAGGMFDFRKFQQGGGFPSGRGQGPQASTGTPPRFPGGPGSSGGMSAPSGLLASMLMHGLGGQAHQGVGDSVKSLAGSPISGAASGISGGISEMIKRKMLGQEFGEQKDPMHLGGTAAIQTFGKGIGEMGVDLLRDMASKAMSAVGHAGDSAAREAILAGLKQTDPVLSAADDKTLMEAYHTMSRFAPVLSTDKNAVRSFLRQAVMSGSGPDYMSIKLLADSERAVTGDTRRD